VAAPIDTQWWRRISTRATSNVAHRRCPRHQNPGVEVVLREHGGHIRHAQVVEVDGPLFEATYSLKSGLWRSGWFDLAALQPSELGSR
jgi:hypothetical protein